MILFEEISNGVNWYEANGSQLQDISTLLQFHDKMAIRSYRLAEYAAECKANYNAAYFIRRIGISKVTQRLINEEKFSKAKAESAAIVECEELYDTEKDTEAAAYKADLLIKQINRILSAVQQRISYLKEERNKTSRQSAVT